jgi:hypothetical protein
MKYVVGVAVDMEDISWEIYGEMKVVVGDDVWLMALPLHDDILDNLRNPVRVSVEGRSQAG